MSMKLEDIESVFCMNTAQGKALFEYCINSLAFVCYLVYGLQRK